MHNFFKKTNVQVGCVEMTTMSGISRFPLLPHAPIDEKEVVTRAKK